ncbi:MAG: phytanoyl-CoA dioxygenase family protein [Methylotenera sp.]|nr:phytanoyl-CoA dioxygenase family protein [Methylotenera sp.]
MFDCTHLPIDYVGYYMQAEFKKNGYVFIKDFFSQAEVDALVADIKEASSTKTDDDVLDKGNLKFHALIMHRSEKLRIFISQPKIIQFLKQFVGPDIWVRWDQAVEKKSGAGTFPWHQDNQYSGLKDAHFQFWISLTTMTADNGGLWVVPGSHKSILKYEVDDNHVSYKGDVSKAEFISAEPGDVVLFSSFLLHSTTPNITQDSRWAYVIEYMRMDKIDPYTDPPHLMVAKDGKSHLEYLDRLPSQDYWINRVKYFNLKKRIKLGLNSIREAVF